jgi:hypothetical protein
MVEGLGYVIQQSMFIFLTLMWNVTRALTMADDTGVYLREKREISQAPCISFVRQ